MNAAIVVIAYLRPLVFGDTFVLGSAVLWLFADHPRDAHRVFRDLRGVAWLIKRSHRTAARELE